MRRIFATNTTDPSRALARTRDVEGRHVQSEPTPQGRDIDTRNAERGRGFLSGDGQMHPHTQG